LLRPTENIPHVSFMLPGEEIPAMLNRTSFAVALLAVASACSSAQADEWLTDLEKARQIAREKNCPILVHFWAT
jgi:hypothetical protein